MALLTGIETVYYRICNMEKAVAFYGGVLGLTLKNRAGNDWAEFDVGGYDLALTHDRQIMVAKARAESIGVECNVGIAERAERLIIIGVAALLTGFGVPYVLPAALWLLGALGLITIGQRMLTVRKQLRAPLAPGTPE